ncbi:MAG: DUF1697 domain-containing protein [Mycobacteriales bacterium]
MAKVAVLLRGVNVGKHKRISMPVFRAVLEGVGCGAVHTYLQSGNAVVDWIGRPDRLVASVAARLQAVAGLSVLVMIRTGAELAAVVEANPFADEAFDPKLLHVAFLTGPPDPDRLAALDHAALLPDRMAVGDRALYLRYATGSQHSPLAKVRLGVEATARNWTTVTALRDLAV